MERHPVPKTIIEVVDYGDHVKCPEISEKDVISLDEYLGSELDGLFEYKQPNQAIKIIPDVQGLFYFLHIRWEHAVFDKHFSANFFFLDKFVCPKP